VYDRHVIGIAIERVPEGKWTLSISPSTTTGTEIKKFLPKVERALPEMVLAISPDKSNRFSLEKFFSPCKVSKWVRNIRGAVKYTQPFKSPETPIQTAHSYVYFLLYRLASLPLLSTNFLDTAVIARQWMIYIKTHTHLATEPQYPLPYQTRLRRQKFWPMGDSHLFLIGSIPAISGIVKSVAAISGWHDFRQ